MHSLTPNLNLFYSLDLFCFDSTGDCWTKTPCDKSSQYLSYCVRVAFDNPLPTLLIPFILLFVLVNFLSNNLYKTLVQLSIAVVTDDNDHSIPCLRWLDAEMELLAVDSEDGQLAYLTLYNKLYKTMKFSSGIDFRVKKPAFLEHLETKNSLSTRPLKNGSRKPSFKCIYGFWINGQGWMISAETWDESPLNYVIYHGWNRRPQAQKWNKNSEFPRLPQAKEKNFTKKHPTKNDSITSCSCWLLRPSQMNYNPFTINCIKSEVVTCYLMCNNTSACMYLIL